MKHLRGAENLRRFNAARETRILVLIKDALAMVLRKKLAFSSIGMLAKQVSLLTDVHRTTLFRNSTYRVLLMEAFRRQRGAVRVISSDTEDVSILRAKLMAADLEISNLREQLRKFMRTLPADHSELGPSSSNEGRPIDAAYREFVDTALALTAVLERLQDSVCLNVSDKTIEDLAAPPSRRIIVGLPRLGAFLKWTAQQPEFPIMKTEKSPRSGV